MATVEKYSPPALRPPDRLKIDLSLQEASNLYTLLIDGVDTETREKLGLNQITSALSQASVTRTWTVEFAYQAEI